MDSLKNKVKFFNTLTRKKEEFIPLTNEKVRMYTCGPTVYNFAHIGNFRTYIFEDLLRRTLQFFGYQVTQVMNITDVDDKTIRGAIAQGVTLDEYTEPYKIAFFEDIKTLKIQPAAQYPEATDYIQQMITMIHNLLEKGLAYKSSDGSVYYAIRKFPHYGCLSHLKMDELATGASKRVANDEYDKENLSDFVLWKGYDPDRDGQIYWESPFGPGRPGWHLECSAMAMELLGETIDIHCGGVDNIFPHHENEIAQSEACTGKQFVKYWLHSEHLIVEGKKMSKSLGNFYSLRDLLDKGFTGDEVRYMLMQTHYRTQLNFTFEGLHGVRTAIARLNDFIYRLNSQNGSSNGQVSAIVENTLEEFATALADDLNISAALASLFDMVREVNILCDQSLVSKSDAEAILDLMKRINTILDVLKFESNAQVPADLQQALKARTEARANKNWDRADELRDFIQSRGYSIEDTPTGPCLKKM